MRKLILTAILGLGLPVSAMAEATTWHLEAPSFQGTTPLMVQVTTFCKNIQVGVETFTMASDEIKDFTTDCDGEFYVKVSFGGSQAEAQCPTKTPPTDKDFTYHMFSGVRLICF